MQCQRRLSGQDADDEDRLGKRFHVATLVRPSTHPFTHSVHVCARAAPLCVQRVSLPGEVRQEYEDQVTKVRRGWAPGTVWYNPETLFLVSADGGTTAAGRRRAASQ